MERHFCSAVVVTFQGAKITGRGVRFGIAIVQLDAITNQAEADRMIDDVRERAFSGIPVVLMALDPQGTPTYYGRADLVRFLVKVDVGSIPWVEYTIE
jgi:hypothetical protein